MSSFSKDPHFIKNIYDLRVSFHWERYEYSRCCNMIHSKCLILVITFYYEDLLHFHDEILVFFL